MLKLTWADAARWRARQQYLYKRAPAGSLLKVASRLCGLHAQVMSSAELMAWARVERLGQRAVQKALWHDRTLVKTWAMRGTLHLLPSTELPMWHAALGISRRYLHEKAWQNNFGIDLAELEQITEAVATALTGCVLTREELMAEVARITGSANFGKIAGSSWGTILKPAAFSGRLCFATSVGTRVRFTNPESWLEAELGSMPVEAATAEVTRRFLTAYGPATVRDLARWWGASMRTARQWITELGDEACTVEVEGTTAWMMVRDTCKVLDVATEHSVRLLPGFDQYVIGASAHAERLLPGVLRGLIYRPQGWVSPVLLVNGRMEGVWRHEVKGRRVEVSVQPFGKGTAWMRRAAKEEAAHLATFLGRELEFVWNPNELIN